MNTSTTYLHIPGLLSAEHMARIDQLSQQGTFEDGKKTASASAKEVKNNLQMNQQTNEYAGIQQAILHALNMNPAFRNATFPKNIYPFLISKYRAGMSYGWHVDSPLMGDMMRTDIAMTIFLNEPEAYGGGELELQSPAGLMKYKLAKGDAILYPCTQVHRVAEVTSGERRVAVTWIESMIKDAAQRVILNDLLSVQQQLLAEDTQSPAAALIMQTHSNLLRMWAE